MKKKTYAVPVRRFLYKVDAWQTITPRIATATNLNIFKTILLTNAK